MPEAVGLFDLDDTLIRRRATFERWATEFSTEHQVPLEWLLKTDPAYSSRRVEFFELVKATFGVRPGVPELHAQYRRRMPELVEPDPQVFAMLAGLREAGWRLGVVTNGMEDNQRAKIHHAGLSDVVDAVVISGAVGIRKPDPRIFHLALKNLRAPAGAPAWMAGDNLNADVGGALAAGLSTVWISHGRALPDDGPQPHHTARTVTEAAALIMQQGGGAKRDGA
ncbi:HAD family hydrolase [Streptomyces sp. URMC 127]|uniref:HAD family hydrolase n=1 Tax=Streptomyces sp. URMC 127 TaxID=3423402 RepID=UPI003F1A519F